MNVYAIVCHKVNNALIHTVNSLSISDDSIIIIHFDKKFYDKLTKQFHQAIELKSNIFLLDKDLCISVEWGTFSQVAATLNLMRFSSSFNYLYFSLISGDDIPLFNSDKLNFILNDNFSRGYEFIGLANDNNAKERIVIDYTRMFYVRNPSIHLRVFKKFIYLFKIRFMRKDISVLPDLYKGTNWFTLSKEVIDYFINYIDSKDYIKHFENSFCPDEFFFHTIFFNSEFKSRVKFTSGENYMCARYIDWTSGPEYPKILKYHDFAKIKKQSSNGDFFFCRKIDDSISLDDLNYFIG